MFSVERKVKQANLVITLSSLPSHHRSCFLSNRVESSLENMDLSGFQEGMSEQHHVFWMTAQVENSEIRIDINLQQFLIRGSEDSLESVPQPISNGWIGKGGGRDLFWSIGVHFLLKLEDTCMQSNVLLCQLVQVCHQRSYTLFHDNPFRK